MTFISRVNDGTEIIYLTLKFEPSTKEYAEIVKIRKPDGSIVFAFPEKRKKNIFNAE